MSTSPNLVVGGGGAAPVAVPAPATDDDCVNRTLGEPGSTRLVHRGTLGPATEEPAAPTTNFGEAPPGPIHTGSAAPPPRDTPAPPGARKPGC